MANLDVVQARTTDMTNQLADYSVAAATTDGATDQKDTKWINDEWTKQYGFYIDIPELRAVTDANAHWTTGGGYTADNNTMYRLALIRGNGVDTFTTILENMERTMQIGGDAFSEIVIRDAKDDEDDYILNVKPLTPEVMVTVFNKKGLITGYEQIDRHTKKSVRKFKPEQIFHLSRNRIADEMHGHGIASVLAEIILSKNEAMADYKKVMHRNVFPRFIFKANTDNTTKLAALQTQIDNTIKNYEHLLLPANTMEHEIMSVAPNATLNPIAWLNYLDDKFYENANCPKIIVGGAGGLTEAAVKIALMTYNRHIRAGQLYIEEQVAAQLGFTIKLVEPPNIENELMSDSKKDGAVNIDPSEVTAGANG